jgi:hypothetical protein
MSYWALNHGSQVSLRKQSFSAFPYYRYTFTKFYSIFTYFGVSFPNNQFSHPFLLTRNRHSSSSIFERDVEPLIPPSPPVTHYYPLNPHRIPPSKGTEQLEIYESFGVLKYIGLWDERLEQDRTRTRGMPYK